MTRTRYQVFEDEYPYFMTDTVAGWLPVFASPCSAEIVLESWRFLRRERGVRILGYVLLENHLHWIAVGENLSKHVGHFKSYTARSIIDELEQRGFLAMLEQLHYFKLRHKIDQRYQLWQEGSHPKQIQTETMLIQKLEYIHANPVRRGYVDEAVHWRYSIARNYAGLEGLIEVDRDWG
jgi:REP element-mobilizing transposase RayT